MKVNLQQQEESVCIAYAWGEDSKEIVDQLDRDSGSPSALYLKSQN
jgi:hypothetical protein